MKNVDILLLIGVLEIILWGLGFFIYSQNPKDPMTHILLLIGVSALILWCVKRRVWR